MKYISLYRALGFAECKNDIYEKTYQNNYIITVNAEKQFVDYGEKIKTDSHNCLLSRHKDFVIFECIDKMLTYGIEPSLIFLGSKHDCFDLKALDYEIVCNAWEDSPPCYSQKETSKTSLYFILYTSRLNGGLIEFKNFIYFNGAKYNEGILENKESFLSPHLELQNNYIIEQTPDINDFEIINETLLKYKGRKKIVVIPNGVEKIAASCFWDFTFIEEVVLPETLKVIGGDSFYGCTNLKRINIPSGVLQMGNNPFAGCENLETINNDSPFFIWDGSVLYNKEKTRLIHYSLMNENNSCTIPEGIKILGKHSFYNSKTLTSITLPSSLEYIENNPFSGCINLHTIYNKSTSYFIKDGIVYNKFMTAVIGSLSSIVQESIAIPEGITLISRNSFWNCKNIKIISFPKSLTRIAYNPFAGCENIEFISNSPYYYVDNGILLNENEIVSAPSARGNIVIPKNITVINRGSFSGCENIKTVEFSQLEKIEKNAFTLCSGLESLFFPESLKFIGEWAFAYCKNLTKVKVSKTTQIEDNAFNGCPSVIIEKY